tara:strand:+ start:13717 stop:14649 length:933 start_codon:yes stop_codon:yes gene_type:complete
LINLNLPKSFNNLPHVLSIDQFSKDNINSFLDFVSHVEHNQHLFLDSLKGKILATLFFEASTRTRLSFESAMFKTGGQVITVEDGNSSSIKKGESLEDMGKVVSQYADIIVVRHPEVLSCNKIAETAEVPVVNAGDGGHEHPTQALLDLYTIKKEKNNFDGLKIGFFGDLKYARSANSTIKALAKYNTTFSFISQEGFELSDELTLSLQENEYAIHDPSKLEEALKECDVLYVTRLQKERILAQKRSTEFSFLTKSHLKHSKSDLMILHPLPRVDEMDKDIDNDPKAFYFKQAKNGVYVRMALLNVLLAS